MDEMADSDWGVNGECSLARSDRWEFECTPNERTSVVSEVPGRKRAREGMASERIGYH